MCEPFCVCVDTQRIPEIFLFLGKEKKKTEQKISESQPPPPILCFIDLNHVKQAFTLAFIGNTFYFEAAQESTM